VSRGLEELLLCMETVLCAAEGTASCQHGLEQLVLFGRLGSMLKNGKVVMNLSALSQMVKKISLFLFNSTMYNHDGQHSNIQVLALLKTKECCTFCTHFHK